MKYVVKVDGRVFEISNSKERMMEIVEILKRLYPNSNVTATGAK